MPTRQRPVAVAIIVRSNRILMIKRSDRPGGISWAFPGGKVEEGEAIERATCREAMEEVGIKCQPRKRLGERTHPQTGRRMHYVLCRYVSGDGVSREPTKISEAKWMTPDEVKASVTSSLFRPVLDYIDTLQEVPVAASH